MKNTIEANILLVDDDLQILFLLTEMLVDTNYQVFTCANGKDAVAKAKENNIDLILLDIGMPDIDGYEVCCLLKKNPATQAVPVIFLTALDRVEEKVRAFGVGGVDYIVKPAQRQEVLARIHNQLCIHFQQKELSDKNAKLQALSQEKDEFLQIVSHDLKNPLSYIIMAAKMLQQPQVKDDFEITTKIVDNGYRILRLIENLVGINDIESGKIYAQMQKVDLTKIIRDLIVQYQYVAEKKQIQLHLVSQQNWEVHTDRNVAHQVLDNLIANAIKYSYHNKTVKISFKRSQEYLCCIIEDEGTGLTDEDKEKMFGKFVRLSSKPTGNESSTGLGLYIVKKLMEAIDGKIWAKSEGKEKGSAFVAEFPLYFTSKIKAANLSEINKNRP